jgi:ATP-dependent DNA helicase DinG
MLSPSEVLADDGPLARLIEGYQARPQQQVFAEAIAEALDQGQSLICEAGTGTGKTFAYLIPAIQSAGKAIISTATKHLQDQLYQKDIPIIREALGSPINIAILKGRANYLCLHRLQLAEEDGGNLSRRNLGYLPQVRQWSTQTVTGDLAELTGIPEQAAIRHSIVSTVENCLGQECESYADCHVYRARRLAAEADIVVVNHHLFLADMSLREQGYGELLPVADLLVFDEAHRLPDLASEFFTNTLGSRQVLELARDCRLAYRAEAADLPEFERLLDRLEIGVRDLRLAFGREDRRAAWFEARKGEGVADAIRNFRGCLGDLGRVLDEFAARGKQLDNCLKRLQGVLRHLDEFDGEKADGAIQWLETRGQGLFLHQTPLDVAGVFQERLRDYACPVIYTSATLAVDGNFRHFAAQLGLQEVAAKVWPSPFDFRTQAMCYLPAGLPDPREPGYTAAVMEASIPVLRLTRGRAFLLFTSHRGMREAAEHLVGKIDFPILVQGDAPRTELLDLFRKTRHAVLLGTSSFWEGVDVRGQALSCVIIDKLPFAAPDDPVLQARLRRLEEQGGSPFMDYQIPEAVISLKQGVGRLIRDRNDYGVLMLCDPRLKTKAYGRIFIKSLPDVRYTSELAEVEAFFRAHERAGE